MSLIQSLYDGFGAGLLEPATGIVAQNRGACFTLDPASPNLLAPGARPAHTLMPVIIQRGGRFEAVAGTMGGSAQPQINAMTLIRAFDLGRSPAEAVAEPRWLVGGMSPEGEVPTAIAEADVPSRSGGGTPGSRISGRYRERTERIRRARPLDQTRERRVRSRERPPCRRRCTGLVTA